METREPIVILVETVIISTILFSIVFVAALNLKLLPKPKPDEWVSRLYWRENKRGRV